MTPAGIPTLVLAAGCVRGGFAAVLTTAVRKEGRKAGRG